MIGVMRHRNDFPGLERYRMTSDEEASLASDFVVVCRDANLIAPNDGDVQKTKAEEFAAPGVYFRTMATESGTYKIYIGKSKSLRRRVGDYLKEFQPHSPNDYKLRVFQQVVFAYQPNAKFQLHFANAGVEHYTELETDCVQKHSPLLNERAQVSDRTREAFRAAFEVFYRQGFEERLLHDA